MLVHLFNSSSVSGPERLVLPALANVSTPCAIVNLREVRLHGLLDNDPLEDYARSFNLPYYAVNVRKRWDRIAIGELHALLHKLNPVLVHAHAIKASAYLLWTRRRHESRTFPLVSTHHGVHGVPDWKVRAYEWFYRRSVLNKYDRALAVSSADYDFLLHSGIESKRLRLHMNGVDGRRMDPEHRAQEVRDIRTRWLPADLQGYKPFLFGVVARLSPEKDHVRLLHVLAELNHIPNNRDWKCLVFGSGPLESTLRQQANEMGLRKRILWMGYRPNIADELAGLDLLLSFSKAEGLPINVIEAGWAGVPVMSTRVGGVIDLIPDESCGEAIEPSAPNSVWISKLRHALSPEGQHALESQGRHFQERVSKVFSQSRWLQRMAEIYAELGVSLDRQKPPKIVKGSLSQESSRGAGVLARWIVLLVFAVLSHTRSLQADIPRPPVLLLTAQENGTQPENTFRCSGPIHGYVTLPQRVSGKHVLEGIWTGPKGNVVRHSQDEIDFPAPGSRTAVVWFRFENEQGSFFNPLSLNTAADEDGLVYNGPWKVEVRWDHQTIAQSEFKVQCRNY